MQAKAKTKNRTKTLLKNETEKKAFNDEEYYLRFQKHLDELKWLYTEVYNNEWMFDELCRQMYQFYTERRDDLKALDRKREADPD